MTAPVRKGTLSRTTLAEEAASGAAATFKAFRKHWPIVVAGLALGTGVGLVVTRMATPIFEAKALIEFDPRPIRPLGEKADSLTQVTASHWDNQEIYQTQYKIMTSETVLSTVARELNLENDADFAGKRRPGQRPNMEDITAGIRGRVTIDPVKSSRLVYIRIEDPKPLRAKRLCEALVATYINQNLQRSVSGTSEALAWLNTQLDAVQRELEASENALHGFKEKNNLPSTSINEASNMLRVEMEELDRALQRARTHQKELSTRYAELQKVPRNDPGDVPASELLASAYLTELRKQYQEAKRDRAESLAEGKGEAHPSVKRLDQRIEQTRTALLAEVRNIEGAVHRDLTAVGKEVSEKSGLFEDARKRAVELNMKEIEYHRLDRARSNNEKVYALLLERSKDADLARMLRVNNVRVVDMPSEPLRPVRPRVLVNLALGVLMGLLGGLGAAWLREQLDVSLKTPGDVEEKLGMSFLGLLPKFSADDDAGPRRRRKPRRPVAEAGPTSELVVHERPLSGVAEAARSIRTNLLFMNPDVPYRTLMVTSSAPYEGKTTVACSIAIAMAQGGQRACIIDCDLRRPRLHRIFDRVGDAGLTSVLVGEATVDEIAKPTKVPNLWSIPAGPIPPNPADVLHSERFKRMLVELSQRFDRIILDTPPLAAVTDAAILSTLVDGTVFVIRAFSTTRALARQGLRSLSDVDAPVVGAVLNSVDLNRHEYSYYQQYYYYKKEGYAPLPASQQEPKGAPPERTDEAPRG